MNLADYLSELLEEHTKVNVPGLGCFAREHISAFYNDTEARFYPPRHSVKFVPEAENDDVLAQFIAKKKNISLASSKYFTEKFVSKLHEDAVTGKFLFSGLGAFKISNKQLVFEPNKELPGDPDFYGYPVVDIFKRPVIPPAPAAKQATEPNNADEPAAMPDAELYNDDREEKSASPILFIVIGAIIVLGIAMFAIYKFNPAFIKKTDSGAATVVQSRPVAKKTAEIRRDTVKDTTKKTPLPADSLSRKPAAMAAAVMPYRWELVVGRYAKYPQATAAVRLFNARGIKAAILTDAPGVYLKVSAGAFDSLNKADSAKKALIYAHKFIKRIEIVKLDNKK